MKKIIMTICAAVAMFTIVSCESNPAIKAGEEFIEKPTVKNYRALQESMVDLSDEDELKEFEEWSEENEDKLWKALAESIGKAFEEKAESMGESMDEAAESMGESIEKAAESIGKAFE